MVTKQDCLTGRYFRYLQGTYSRSKELKQVRASGKCQTWKTRPDDFKLPVKYGMYESLYITPENAALFITEDEYQSRKEQAQAVGQVLKNPGRNKWDNLIGRGIEDTEIHTWFERDRSHVELRNKRTQKTIVEWWDEAVQEAVEDGFLQPRDWHGSAYQYAKEMGMLGPKRKTMRKNPAGRKFPVTIGNLQDVGATIRKNRYGEYVVRLWKKGKHYAPADYFTNDADDALATAGDMVDRASVGIKVNPTKLRPLGANQTELETDDGATVLFSYQTPVAIHIPGTGYFKTDKKWSATTSKHISTWLKANGASTVKSIAQEKLDGVVQSGAASHDFRKNPRNKRRVIEIAEQAGMLGWHVFVDGMYDADIRPSNTAHDALRKAYKAYPRTGQYGERDFTYYSDVIENPRLSVPRERIAQWAGSRVKRKRAMERALPAKRGGHIHVQQQRGTMWFTLAVANNTDKGRLLAKDWALRYHRRHPGTTLRLFA